MARDLVTVLNESVYTAINGYDASTDKLMFNNYGDKDTMTRTTDNWIHALQGSTGIPALNNKTFGAYQDGAIYGGALITPRHAIFAAHSFLQPQSVLYFWDRSNVRYTRTVLKSVSSGAAGSWALSNLAPRIVSGQFDPGFFVDHFVKDLGIAMQESKRMSLKLPGLELACELYDRVVERGDGQLGTHALQMTLSEMSKLNWASRTASA